MECPYCQDDDISIIRTVKKYNLTERKCLCNNCGLVFLSEERITQVKVLFTGRRKQYYIPVDEYRRNELYNERREVSDKQLKIFRECRIKNEELRE